VRPVFILDTYQKTKQNLLTLVVQALSLIDSRQPLRPFSFIPFLLFLLLFTSVFIDKYIYLILSVIQQSSSWSFSLSLFVLI